MLGVCLLSPAPEIFLKGHSRLLCCHTGYKSFLDGWSVQGDLSVCIADGNDIWQGSSLALGQELGTRESKDLKVHVPSPTLNGEQRAAD